MAALGKLRIVDVTSSTVDKSKMNNLGYLCLTSVLALAGLAVLRSLRRKKKSSKDAFEPVLGSGDKPLVIPRCWISTTNFQL